MEGQSAINSLPKPVTFQVWAKHIFTVQLAKKFMFSFTEGVSNLWCVRKSCRTFIKFPRIFNGTLKFEFRVLIASSIVLFLLLQILSLMFNTKASQTSALLCQSRWCRCSSSFRPWSQLNSIKTFSWRVKVDWNVIFCSHLVLAQNLPQNLHTKIQEFFGFPAYSGAIPKV